MEETENEKEMRPTLSKREVEHEQAIKNPIAATISTLIHKLRDFEECADKFLPAASQMRVELLTGTARQIKDALSLIKSQDQHTRVVGIKQALDWTRKSERAIHSDPERVLRESLFMGMFSAFDAFSGDLMRAVFQKKPALFRCLNRTVTISEVLECSTLDDLKRV